MISFRVRVSVPTLLATKQKKGESVKAFVECFRSMALKCQSGMTSATLVETCRHNLQTSLLTQMGVADCTSWKQLVSVGERAEAIVARLRAEEDTNKSKQGKSNNNRAPDQSPRSKGKDTMATESST